MTDDNQGRRNPTPETNGDFVAPENQAPPKELVETAPLTANVELQQISGVVGRYNVIAWLGGGGFGDVYKAWDEELRRDVALKVLKGNADSKTGDALLAEARLLAQLDHPAIVPVYDIGRTSSGQVFIVSKYVQGRDLAKLIRHEKLTQRQATELVARIAEALAYAHDRGIVHRDVKPGNILVHRDGMPVLADFGLAMREADYGRGSRSPGTPLYMSPEQARGEGHRVDGRSDVYSLGTVFYELLTGSPPFRAATIAEVLDCIRNVDVRPPRQIDHHLPKELDRICLRALARRASDRYSTAADMADDLRHWLNAAVETNVVRTAEQSHSSTPDPKSSQKASEVVVVPRGLRPFEAGDADFFLHLLPGPRDRHGIPDSVQFWKSRIEETDSDATFRVGLLLGPSGSGKSSLIRAGVLPRLDEKILVIFLEARADDLEQRLAERIQRRVPGTPPAGSLRELLAHIRQRHGLLDHQKMVIVIDQFEQWLNRHDPQTDTGLSEALRQCDGATIQTLLLVRDDFTYAATQLMEVLEEPLLQNRNFATVDLFGIEHAHRVLAAFGRSFGAVSDPPSREHQRFLEAAVAELAHDRRVIPVQLAIFAEMVKDKPWSAATLRDLGGMAGIGIAFLEDRLAGPAAHPLLRANLPIVRSLLEALLPDADIPIKGPAKTRAELMQAVAATADQELLDKLLGLLDTEIRLITPTGGDITSSRDSSATTRESKYQLSHDYLVPAIRDWLSAEQRSTRKGRARIRLRELSQTWNAKPDPRRLPTFFEWASIRALTRPHEWSPSQRRMMRAAGGRFRRRALIITGLLLLLFGIGWESSGRAHARVVRDRLLNFNTTEILPVLAEARRNARWVNPLLRQDKAQLNAASPPFTDLQQRQRLHLALAEMSDDMAESDYVLDRLPQLPPDQQLVIAQLIAPLDRSIHDSLWQRFDSALQTDSGDALAYGAVLARTDTEHNEWKRHLPAVARRFSKERPAHIGQWIALYEPMARPLAVELARVLESPDALTAAEKTNLCEAIAVFATKDTATLVAATQHAQLADLQSLFAAMQHEEAASRTELRRRLLAISEPLHSKQSPAPAPAALQTLVEHALGQLDATCGITHATPFGGWEDVLQTFAAGGYRPQCVRPYWQKGELFVAAVWTHDGRRAECRSQLRAEELAETDRQMQAKGLRMVDLCAYNSEVTGPKKNWAALWVEPETASTETRFYLDLPLSKHEQNENEWPAAGYSITRFDIHAAVDGEPTCMAIWTKTNSAATSCFTLSRDAFAFGDMSPGSFQTDCRITALADKPERLGLWFKIIENTRDAQAGANAKNAAYRWLLVAKYRSAIGDFQEASRIVEFHRNALKDYALFDEYSGILHARMSDPGALKKDIESYRRFKKTGKTGMLEYLEFRLALLDGDQSVATERLATLQRVSDAAQKSEPRSETVELLARATVLMAVRFEPNESDGMWRQKALELVRRTVVESHTPARDLFLFDVDLDGLRSDPKFLKLLKELGVHQQYVAAYTNRPAEESEQLIDLTPAEHARSAMQLRQDGFVPASISVRPTVDGLGCCSVWRRSVISVEQRVKTARAQCNLILGLARLGEIDALMDALQSAKDRELQSQLVVWSPMFVPAAVLVDALRSATAPEKSAPLLAVLAGYAPERLASQDLTYLQARLPALASGTDASLAASASHCLTKWKWQSKTPMQVPATSPTSQNWFRNSAGQMLVVVSPPEKFLMGSPKSEPSREDSEILHWAKIHGKYALSSTEVTESQFAEFMKDEQYQRLSVAGGYTVPTSTSESGQNPQAGVHWFHAAAYCQWLSERENMPESQWCYPGIWNMEDKGFTPPSEYRRRTGYRLPTEMEWEYAARAGASQARHCGDDEMVLSFHEWVAPHAQGRPHAVGSLRPNAFGFFDMLGNVHEWCDDRQDSYHRPIDGYIRNDNPGSSQASTSQVKYVIRGGSFSKGANEARAANRAFQWSDYHSAMLGFRIARTMEN